MRRHSTTLAVVIALVALVASGAPSNAENSAGVTAVYRTADVWQSGDSVSMSFTVRLFNTGDETRNFSLVKLADRANANIFAQWENVTVPANGKLDLSDSVTVTATEYVRWKNGGPANLFVVQPDPMGTTRATAISAIYQVNGW